MGNIRATFLKYSRVPSYTYIVVNYSTHLHKNISTLRKDILGGLGMGKSSNIHFEPNPSTRLLSSFHVKLVSGAVPNAVRYTYAWHGFPGEREFGVPWGR